MPHKNLRTALGISVGHGDSSAALVVGNELVAAVEEANPSVIVVTVIDLDA